MLGGNKLVTDRVGSVVRHGGVNLAYYPYGQERTTSANDQPKFGTYTRDSHSGLDYAMNRYYFSNWGRFTTPDPYRASGGPANPQSWNRYAYVEGDPVNSNDPAGLDKYTVDYLLNGQIECIIWQNREGSTVMGCRGLKPVARSEAVSTALAEKLSLDVPHWIDKWKVTNDKMRGRLQRKINGLGKPCVDAINALLNDKGISIESLAGAATFWDARDFQIAALKAGDLNANARLPDSTLGTWAARLGFGGAAAVTIDYLTPGTNTLTASGDVILNPAFSQLSAGNQDLVLLHEALHAATGWGDERLAREMGIVYGGGMSPNAAITAFISLGCDKGRAYGPSDHPYQP